MALTRREAAARLMEHLCSHDGDAGHGYSQYAREGAGSERVSLGDGVTVNVPGGDRDCSSAIISVLRAVGIDVGGATYTGNMRSQLTRGGQFYVSTNISAARRGDIYLNDAHHTAMCLGNGKLAEFSISETGGISGRRGDQTAWESHIRSYYRYSKGWNCVLMWANDGGTIGSAPTGGAYVGSCNPPQSILLHDGFFGPLTVEYVQRRIRDRGYYPASKYVIDGDFGTATKTELQRFLRDQGEYPASKYLVDGDFGYESVRALQRWLLSKGCYWNENGPCLVDGSWGSLTTIGIQRAINAGVL